ncbi:hypothetical protein T439DRAFT_321614 [Meredithblackwellia eburnea MCA 4105]
MSPILSLHPGSLNAFALRLRSSDSLASIQARAARKLAIPGDGQDINLQYLWCDVYYTLEDDDDWDVFVTRTLHEPEVTLLLTSPSIPNSNPSIASISSLPPSMSGSATNDAGSVYSSSGSYGGVGTQQAGRASVIGGLGARGVVKGKPSMHLLSSSGSSKRGSGSSVGGKSATTVGARSGRGTAGNKSLAPSVPQHKIEFEQFHNQLGVRTFIGSIGPVENVRMMMKSGHRACYMSRAFAQQHAFIPKDAAPGFYGFSGITNLGTWPIKVGKKTVEQQVMLVENSYFPVILGRSFMERRGVRTDPLDQTSVVFMDTNEVVPTDLVIVKDAAGDVITIS